MPQTPLLDMTDAPQVPVLGGHDIVTFANDWTADPTSKHHIMRRFAQTNDILWVEAAGMRVPKLISAYDRRRLVTKAKAMFRRSRPALDRLHVLSPPALPYPHSTLAQQANALLYNFSIGRELERLEMDRDPILCSFVPQCAPYIRRLPRRLLIYYCVDRWSAFEGFNASTMERGERELCETADLVIASAEDLAERCSRYSSNVHYVPHGVDYAHFASALTDAPLPADLASIPGPRIGFFGLIHEWVDVELIGRLADALPYSFVVIGSAKTDMSAVEGKPNVHVLGRRPYAELPAYSRGFQAAIVPFRMTELTHSVNPIKLREYAAAGLPIVSSPLPEVLKCTDIAACATTFDEWVVALRAAVDQGTDATARAEQSARVKHEDWAYRCNDIARFVADADARRQPRAGRTTGG
jgi:glycosyltransferase involved in cell wall biosynthesis